MEQLEPINAEHLRKTANAICLGLPNDELEAHPAYRAADRIEALEHEVQSAVDFAEDRARLLNLVREKLGVPSEPHQSIDERTFEAIDDIAAWNAVEWSAIAVLKLLEEIEQQVGAAIPPSILNDALAKVGLRERFGNEAIDRAKKAARGVLAEKFASGEEGEHGQPA